MYKYSTPEQAYIEARAQIKKALDAGIDVTHLDSHMGTLQYNDAYFQVYRRLAKEFDVPLRMAAQEVLAANGGGHQRGQLDSDGVVCPDFLIYGGPNKGESVTDYWKRMLTRAEARGHRAVYSRDRRPEKRYRTLLTRGKIARPSMSCSHAIPTSAGFWIRRA